VTILGMELSGVVEETGLGVTQFKASDPVFAFAGFGFGGYAEYRCLPANSGVVSKGLVAIKPHNLTHTEAAAVPAGGLTAQAILRQGNLKEGQQVLIYGASGSVGTYALQLARHAGAEVTAVCSSRNIPLVTALGAVRAIDYTQEDFTGLPERYDLVFDAVGKLSHTRARKALKPGGTFLSAHGSARIEPQDLDALKELIEAGHLRPVIDRCYPLEQVVEAHRYVDAGHKRGNVVILVDDIVL
jgi:NADPH:quinone reductase-like Zn-dependent oxidoreductase